MALYSVSRGLNVISRIFRIWQIIAGVFGFFVCTVEGQSKSQYHLFNPTPKEQMRPLVTDRPDKTESAYTVDAGHFLIESDLVIFAWDHSGSEIDRHYTFFAPNLKAGLLNNVDFQIIPEAYVSQRDDVKGHAATGRSGVGDTTARLKLNLWGNDGGETAFAAMPFIKFPTNRNGVENDHIEEGIIFPFAMKLPAECDIGAQTAFKLGKADNRDAYATVFINSATFGFPIISKLAGYSELYTERSSEPGSSWILTGDGGLIYQVNLDLQFDAGINVGLTDEADDLNPFIGVSYRL